VRVRAVDDEDLVFLGRIKSPLYLNAVEAFKKSSKRRSFPMEEKDIFAVIYLFTRPLGECQAALDLGMESFRLTVLREVVCKLNPFTLPEIGLAIAQNAQEWSRVVEDNPAPILNRPHLRELVRAMGLT